MVNKYIAMDWVKKVISTTTIKTLIGCRKLIFNHYVLYEDIEIHLVLGDALDKRRSLLVRRKKNE